MLTRLAVVITELATESKNSTLAHPSIDQIDSIPGKIHMTDKTLPIDRMCQSGVLLCDQRQWKGV